MKAKVCAAIDAWAAKVEALAQDIEREPELGFKETKTAAKVTAFLQQLGLTPQTGLALTGVKARVVSGRPGPTVAVLGELDAIGCPDSCKADPLTGAAHACGHNLQVATMAAVACGITQSGVLSELSGDAVFFGVPAEEYVELAYRNKLIKEGKLHFLTGKGQLIYEGAFDDIDMAMQMHADKNMPAATVSIGESSNGFIGKTIQYVGKTAHAASCPEKGINALNSVIQLFNGIDALRQHVTPDVKMHGIITKGGVAANIVPDEAVADFYFRASTKERVTEVIEKVKKIAEGAALMTGATLEMERYELPYDDLKTNEKLSEMFNENLRALGITDINPGKATGGSSDIGNVSHVAPTIHPYIGITDCPMIGHSVEMAKATTTKKAHDRLLIAALAMAYTGYDVIVRNESLRK